MAPLAIHGEAVDDWQAGVLPRGINQVVSRRVRVALLVPPQGLKGAR
jgi:hypothetical protein